MGKNKTTAAVLALLGGVIGMHKFYLNDPGAGIFYTIMSILTSSIFFMPLGALLGVLDAVRLFSMSTAQFDAKFNKRNNRKQGRGRQADTNLRERPARKSNRDVTMSRARYQVEQATSKSRSNPFRKSADQKFKEYDLEGALEDYKKSAEITAADKEMYFNMASIYSLLEKTDESLIYLEKAIDLGFKDLEKIKTVDELAFLRIQPDYEAFVNNNYKKVERAKAVEPPKDDLLQDDLLLSQLNKLKELRSRGLLSEREYIYEKDKLMRN